MIITLEHYFLWFLFYSFVGWMYESILVSCQQHRLVNRGFLNGPLCPIYGTGAILGVAILGNVHNPIIIFLISMVGATILEYTTSWVMEQLFHARWWDYSNFRFNLQGRVCLLGALIFGLGGVGVVLGSQPYVERVTDMIPLPMLRIMLPYALLICVAALLSGMLNTLGNANTFWVYGGLNVLFILLTLWLIPETKNVSLEHIERNLMQGRPLREIGARD